MAPAFQIDPSTPQGSVRIVHDQGSIELQNYHDRPVSVFLLFIRADTAQDLVLLAQSTAAVLRQKKEDPP